MPDLLTGASRKAAIVLRIPFGVQAEQAAGLPHCIIRELLTLHWTMGISCSMDQEFCYKMNQGGVVEYVEH